MGQGNYNSCFKATGVHMLPSVRSERGLNLKPFVTFAYKTGWRLSEISTLTWNQGIVRLEVGETKNDEGRTVYLDKELKETIYNQLIKRSILFSYVFLNCHMATFGFNIRATATDDHKRQSFFIERCL